MDNEEGTIKRSQKNIQESNQLFDITSEFPKGEEPESEEDE